MCLSVCYHHHDGTDRRADLNFGMEVKFVGEGHRSKVEEVTRSKNVH